jgi:hypothetical protein
MNAWKLVIENKKYLKALSLLILGVSVALLSLMGLSFIQYQGGHSKIAQHESALFSLAQNTQNFSAQTSARVVDLQALNAMGSMGQGLARQYNNLNGQYQKMASAKAFVNHELGDLSRSVQVAEKKGIPLNQLTLVSQFAMILHQEMLVGQSDSKTFYLLNSMLSQFNRSSPQVYALFGTQMTALSGSAQNYLNAQQDFTKGKVQLMNSVGVAQASLAEMREKQDQQSSTAMMAIMALFGAVLVSMAGLLWYVFHRHNYEYLSIETEQDSKNAELIVLSENVAHLLADTDNAWANTLKEKAMLDDMSAKMAALHQEVEHLEHDFNAQSQSETSSTEDLIQQIEIMLAKSTQNQETHFALANLLNSAHRVDHQVKSRDYQLDTEIETLEQSLRAIESKITDLQYNTQVLLYNAQKVRQDRIELSDVL